MAFEKRWKYPTKTGGTRHDRELSIYSIWYKMVRRCTNPKDNVYDRYGGRGITVCEAWLSYDRFFEWAMSAGYSEGLTIDRIDNDQGYFPANCRWADRKVQTRNTSRNVYVGDECVAQIAERVGMPYSTVYERYKRGYISDEELAAPVNTLNATRRWAVLTMIIFIIGV